MRQDPSAFDRRWDQIHRSAEPLRLPVLRTLVVAPHRDDETLLAGGLIASQRRRGIDVQVVAVTDGESAYGGADKRLAQRRRGE